MSERFFNNPEQKFSKEVHQQDWPNWALPHEKFNDVADDTEVLAKNDDYLFNPAHRSSIPGLDESFLFDDYKRYLGVDAVQDSDSFQLIGLGIGPPSSGKSKLFGEKFTSRSGTVLLPQKDFFRFDMDAERIHFLPFIEATNGALFCQGNMDILKELRFEVRPWIWIHPKSYRKFPGMQVLVNGVWVYASYPNIAANAGRANVMIAMSVARRLVFVFRQLRRGGEN